MNLRQLNYSLVKAAEHLAEAGQYLMVIDEERGVELLEEADFILSLVKIEEEKVSQDRLDEVLGEIFSNEGDE